MIFAAYIIEDEVITQRLLLEAKYLKKEYVINPTTLPRGKHFTLYYRFEDMPEGLSSQLRNKLSDKETLVIDDKEYRYFHFYIALDREAYLVVDVSEVSLLDSISDGLITLILTFIIITLLLSAGLTYLISKNTINPLITITDAIKRQKSMIPKLPEHLLSRDDELGYLTNSLKNSYKNLSLALDRESEFTRDVSHELRTPISVMMNTLTLAHGKPLSTIKQEVIERQVKLMNNRVQMLLALARAESIEKKSISLLSAVEESILSLHKLVEEKNFKIVINITLMTKVNANEHLMKLMLCNLIENAIKHSSENGMVISGSENELTVSNRTNNDVNNDLVEKYNKSADSDGLGQGLFLVSRILGRMGWTFELASSKTDFSLKILF
jgi:signal transduction histidine kinase